MQLTEQTVAKAQATVGVALAAAPLWTNIIQGVSMVASCVAAVCGAIIGVYGVVKLWRGRKK